MPRHFTRKAETSVGMGKPSLSEVINERLDYEENQGHNLIDIKFLDDFQAYLIFERDACPPGDFSMTSPG